MLCGVLFKSLMSWGTLRVVDARGKMHEFTGTPGPEITVRLHDSALHYRLFWNPRLALGEAYMEGTLTIENGARIIDLIDLLGANLNKLESARVVKIRNWLTPFVRPIQQHNPVSRARRNVAHHYDLSDRLFDLFLDSDRQYSCAYFETPNDSLEQAQLAKKHHLASKLVLDRPGLKMLDIGSGWGGLGIYMHQQAGAEVTGLTLSTEQCAYAMGRVQKLGISDHVRFDLRDYRQETGRYDRIVSVGMFEHVGVKYYTQFFNKLKSLLTEDGIAVLHTIARWDGPSVTNPWLRKYIFPGGYTPALSEVFAAIEPTGLKVLDMEILRLHYAETLKHWSRNFAANRDKVKAIYDERFCRMWEFYLAGAETAFRRQGHMIAQLQIARQQDAAPLTRDYLVDWKRANPL
ncbi:MAG: cyclopropane-fatty-acyl-phospholipid synthase family protein [Alphaproteobacteria bacterium]|jgi:cyclopropane-fatty-acyl-phospholipid synthase|nr:cyclopropane-fatty-acyl-phospholipid synthase family protein [Alphaproteobacteria bacterium]MDP6588449.1 cyclopropane-fatty-acyl-phospholipid synthase family protein [Alphaproteobacteria bacterium]|tara:strand:+ start:1374 stop:2588 length:1215 start_codon:yes stop_codon:yes gene_type:complete